jgi:hypothetical protein
MQLFFKRAKIFMLNQKGVSLRYVGTVSSAGTADSRVPDWVRETETFKAGVADGSIIDLTPQPARRREAREHKALGHDPLKEAKVVDTPVSVDETLSASEGDDSAETADESAPAIEEAPASETGPAHRPFGGSTLPQKTPKGFTAQPTASGRRAAK